MLTIAATMPARKEEMRRRVKAKMAYNAARQLTCSHGDFQSRLKRQCRARGHFHGQQASSPAA